MTTPFILSPGPSHHLLLKSRKPQGLARDNRNNKFGTGLLPRRNQPKPRWPGEERPVPQLVEGPNRKRGRTREAERTVEEGIVPEAKRLLSVASLLGTRSSSGHRCGSGSQAGTPASQVPCKFFRQGACQAGKACLFLHSEAPTVCKYFQKAGLYKFPLD